MQFLINLFNHNPAGQRSLEDPIGIIGHQLQALGHKVVWEQSNQRLLTRESGINIMIEGFTPASTQVVAEAHSRGARFICVATEEPTPRGFNHGRDNEMVKRQHEFPNAAKYFEGILYLVPGAGPWYSQWAPTAYVELGWAATLVRPGDWQVPEYDFGFFGSWSRRREQMCRRLARYVGSEKTIRVVADFPDQVTRDRIMREAKVILQIRKFDEMGLVSSTRCNTALCLGRPVIAEPHLLSKPWDEVIKFSTTTETFFQDALMMRMAWKGVWSSQFEKFRAKFTPQYCIGRALEEIKLDLSMGPPIVASTAA